MAVDTGNGATFAFTSGSFTARVTSIDLGSWSLPVLDDSGLDTTDDEESVMGDLKSHDPITVNYLVDVTSAAKWEPPTGLNTATITFPNQGGAGAATYVGTGFVMNVGRPTLENNSLMAGTFQFKPDAKTGPTFTADGT